MQPQNPFDPTPSGIDYLNQIAAPAPPTGFDKKSKIIMIIMGIIGILSLIFILVAAQNTAGNPSPMKMIARIQKLKTVASDYTPKLRSSKLQDANSSLVAVLTTAEKSVETPAAAQNIDLKKQAKAITALDPADDLKKKFDEAYLNVNLDATYAYTMSTELADTILMMEKLNKASSSKSMKEFLTKTIADLTQVRKQLTAITEADGA